MLRNWKFFNAPHAAFFTMATYLKLKGAVDLGIYAQTLALLMTERGISSRGPGSERADVVLREIGSLPVDIRGLESAPIMTSR